ncbi:hypothetical protein K0651_05490 [Ornithinimicrobium sp. Arc0846-15]|nr:hypothetical protein [Ornithinimicrobium laminariae]
MSAQVAKDRRMSALFLVILGLAMIYPLLTEAQDNQLRQYSFIGVMVTSFWLALVLFVSAKNLAVWGVWVSVALGVASAVLFIAS